MAELGARDEVVEPQDRREVRIEHVAVDRPAPLPREPADDARRPERRGEEPPLELGTDPDRERQHLVGF